ncbi:unnamed protein product, partial [Didymodactylos carnosus]
IFIAIFDEWDLKGLNIKRLLLEVSRLCLAQTENILDIDEATIPSLLWSICLDGHEVKLKRDLSKLMIKLERPLPIFGKSVEEE